MKTAYYDAAFLLRVFCDENGYAKIRAHVHQLSYLCCSMHGRAECVAAIHRKWREGILTREQSNSILKQIDEDTQSGLFTWLPLTEKHLAHVEAVFRKVPKNLFLRASDALHLAVAAEHGFKEIFSNDRHLLSAASYFGVRGKNLLN